MQPELNNNPSLKPFHVYYEFCPRVVRECNREWYERECEENTTTQNKWLQELGTENVFNPSNGLDVEVFHLGMKFGDVLCEKVDYCLEARVSQKTNLAWMHRGLNTDLYRAVHGEGWEEFRKICKEKFPTAGVPVQLGTIGWVDVASVVDQYGLAGLGGFIELVEQFCIGLNM